MEKALDILIVIVVLVLVLALIGAASFGKATYIPKPLVHKEVPQIKYITCDVKNCPAGCTEEGECIQLVPEMAEQQIALAQMHPYIRYIQPYNPDETSEEIVESELPQEGIPDLAINKITTVKEGDGIKIKALIANYGNEVSKFTYQIYLDDVWVHKAEFEKSPAQNQEVEYDLFTIYPEFLEKLEIRKNPRIKIEVSSTNDLNLANNVLGYQI